MSQIFSRRAIGGFVGTAVSLSIWAGTVLSASADTSVPIADLLSVIKNELRAAQKVTIGEPRLELRTVTLELATVIVRAADGKIEVGVPQVGLTGSVGGTTQDTGSSKVKIQLAPPSPQILMGDAPGPEDIAKTIVEVRRQLQRSLSQEPRLDPQTVTMEIEFGIKRAVEAGGKIEFLVFSASAGGKGSRAETNRIMLEFIRPRGP